MFEKRHQPINKCAICCESLAVPEAKVVPIRQQIEWLKVAIMSTRPRKNVRPHNVSSINRKRFVKVNETPKTVQTDQVHPLVVVADLRRGSLESLDKYLAQQGGIPDQEIAGELRKIINGSAGSTPFRLMVLDHPNLPKDKGGRRKSTLTAPSPRDVEIAALYEAQFFQIDKKKAAAEQVALAEHVSLSTVKRALKRVEAYRASMRSADEDHLT